jgi:AraC family transcriptional regulator of adaptative response / DNA-3-methyladenine glycosylase II
MSAKRPKPAEADPESAALRAAVAAGRADPAGFPDIGAFAREAGVGETRLRELCRREYHREPTEILARARVEKARVLLIEGCSVDATAAGVGCASPEAFADLFGYHQHFDPTAFQRLAGAREFVLTPSRPIFWPRLLSYWGRDPRSASERVQGGVMELAIRLPPGPALLRLERRDGLIQCTIDSASVDPTLAFHAHAVVLRQLGLENDPAPFETQIQGSPWPGLVAGREGLTVPQTANVWDGLVWVVAGQQVSLVVAFGMRRRLTMHFGDDLGNGLWAPPPPERVAQSSQEELVGLGFSRAKADYLLNAARAVAAGFDLEALRLATAPGAAERLGALRGLGPWSVNYLCMRSLGLLDCVPIGDVALLRSLAEFFELPARPDVAGTLALMAPFAPYRSLATFHLWSRLEKKA